MRIIITPFLLLLCGSAWSCSVCATAYADKLLPPLTLWCWIATGWFIGTAALASYFKVSLRFIPGFILALGMIIAAGSLWQLSWLNLDTGYWNIFWPQFIQGAALALLFVPLTTIAMDAIPREEMGNATSIFNLMRNIGGSVGIALASTFLFRRQPFKFFALINGRAPRL